MSNHFVNKLVESINELEQAVLETKKTLLSSKDLRPDLLDRIACYEEVLKKQRILIKSLSIAAQTKNTEQVKRFVDLIKGSSLLIQLDSQSFVSDLQNNSVATESDTVTYN